MQTFQGTTEAPAAGRPPLNPIYRAFRLKQMKGTARIFHMLARSKSGRLAIGLVRASPFARRVVDLALGIYQTYPSLAHAEQAVGPFANDGHECSANVDLHLVLSETPRVSDYAAMFHLKSVIDGTKRVFDLGGNVGNLFYCYRRYLAIDDQTTWIVYDLPKNIERGRTLGARRGASRLRFTDELRDASDVDVLIASGCLHYFEPLPVLLSRLALKPRHVLINRMPLIDRTSTAIVQEVGSFRVACMLYDRKELISGMNQAGYRLCDAWEAPELRLEVPAHPELQIRHYSGFWFSQQQQMPSE